MNKTSTNNPVIVLESKGQSGAIWLFGVLAAIIAGIACLYFGLTPMRRHYRFGAYVMLPDPNWFLFGVGIALFLCAIILFFFYINRHFSKLVLDSNGLSGRGTLLSLVHILLPVSLQPSEIKDVKETKNALIIRTATSSYAFYIQDHQKAYQKLRDLLGLDTKKAD